jgi:menaquinone-9 beta-reductase
VVVGARCAGSAVAAMLAAEGRRVVVLDRARFPADTLSTHAMFPIGCAELQRIGVWPRILSELDPARLRYLQLTIGTEVELRERWQAVDGIDYGVSIPRDLLDVLLVENARERGADVRERCAVEEVIWEHGRAVGVGYRDEHGARRRVRAAIVIGADGRRSTVAARVGAWRPYRASKNGRGLVFRYMDDPAHEPWHRETMWQWRDGDSLAFAFPNPNGRVLALFMGDTAEVAVARRDPEGYWASKLARHPGCAARIAGATDQTKIRSADDTLAYWRASSGPGWVLAGDASHFKDPVTGQGMGDALRMGRTLGEALAATLGDPLATDRCTRRWEHATATHCLHAYHFANFDTIVQPVSPVLKEVVRELGRTSEPELSQIFGRTRTAQQVITYPLVARALARALWRGPDRLRILRAALADGATESRVRRELSGLRFRSSGPVRGSDHPGWVWWDPPTPVASAPIPGPPDRVAAVEESQPA